jgi:hypothetical protein
LAVGLSSQVMNAVIPAWATEATQVRSWAPRPWYQGKPSSMSAVAAVVSELVASVRRGVIFDAGDIRSCLR